MIILRRIPWSKWRKRVIFMLIICFTFCLPKELFKTSYATVLEDSEGSLLMATIASDGQWRFPPGELVPNKFEKAIIEFEDRGFYRHFGMSFRSIGRAIIQNIRSKRIVSGGSTLSMQVIRMSRERKGRAIGDKLLEMFMAVRLEFRYSKKEILALYAAHAPFGGNVVGLEAASWRYFGHHPDKLSWAEAATLAVLPNAPSLMHPGKNRQKLLEKRNRLLKRMLDDETLTKGEYDAAIEEPLPEKPSPLPQLTPHYLNYLSAQNATSNRFKTTIEKGIQRHVNAVTSRHHVQLSLMGIENMGVVVLHVPTGEVKAYVGNNLSANHAAFVDVIQAPRSTGSILKPFLYASAMEAGKITPQMLLPDYPTRIHGYTPHNYEDRYDGMVPASQALARSLNIPAVRLLSEYGVSRFKTDLERLGLTTLFRPSEDYGLSLILGGAEANLWDLAHAYRSLALCVLNGNNDDEVMYSPSVAYELLNALCAVNRPGEEQFWQRFDNKHKIAWKTGTSFGARDAWAIGVNREYVVAVWVGNANGEGVSGMTGSSAAGPILFDVFAGLSTSKWFDKPVRDMRFVEMCAVSGHRAGLHCPYKKSQWLPRKCLISASCKYHKLLFLNKNGTERRYAGDHDMFKHYKFILPVAAAFYYKAHHPEYQNLPPELGVEQRHKEIMSIVYPQPNSVIRIPKLMNGELGEATFETVHQSEGVELYWFVDNNFITSTKDIHQINVQPQAGKHQLTVVDQDGLKIIRHFEIEYSGD